MTVMPVVLVMMVLVILIVGIRRARLQTEGRRTKQHHGPQQKRNDCFHVNQFSFPENIEVRAGISQRPCQEVFLTQRRKGAKKSFGNAAALCAFPPLREKYSKRSGVTDLP
jgi:hypothetical protein